MAASSLGPNLVVEGLTKIKNMPDLIVFSREL